MWLLKHGQSQRNIFPQEEKGQKRVCKKHHRIYNLRQTVYHKNVKTKLWQKKIIVNLGATSQIVKLEENMSNLKDAKTWATEGDSRTLTEKKLSNWYGYHRRGRKLHHVTLYNTAIISGLHANIFIVTLWLKQSFQVILEGETLILKKNPTTICFENKLVNNGSKLFLLTTKFYKSSNDTALLDPDKHNPEGKESVQP